jgi:hypothetical protein
VAVRVGVTVAFVVVAVAVVVGVEVGVEVGGGTPEAPVSNVITSAAGLLMLGDVAL